MGAISLMDLQSQTPQMVRRGILIKVTNTSVTARRLRWIPCPGFSYHYPEFAKLPGVAFRAIGGTYTADNGIVNPKAETLAILGGSVQTDHQMYSADARGNAIIAKVKKAALTLDNYVINGDPNVDPKQFYGLKARIAGAQLLDMGNGGNGNTLGLGGGTKMVDKLLDAVAGTNNQKILLMNKEARRQLKAVIITAAGGAQVGDIGGSLPSYDGCPIEVLDEDGDEAAILPQTEAFGTSADCCSIYCIRPGEDIEGEFVQGLIGMGSGAPFAGGVPTPPGETTVGLETYPSGMVGTQHVDIVEGRFGLAVFNGRAAARLQGVRKA